MFLTFFAEVPVPRDLPLPLPVPAGLLTVLLVVFFLIHILFINLMVGGSVLVAIAEWIGLKNKRWDHLAHAVARTVTVNKSLAVVMGIGPLLCINLLYTIQWYSANSLTGHAWLLIVPLVIVAFLLTYLHKYTWERWSDGAMKKAHLTIAVLAAVMFLCIPVIFLANVNLMLFPDQWSKVRGFFSSLSIGNVFPRYLHFVCASMALTGLFFVGWFGRERFDLQNLPGFTRPELKRIFYKVAAYVTMVQFIAGPLLLFTLPSAGLSVALYVVIVSGAFLGAFVLWLLLKEIRSADDLIGRRFVLICGLFSLVVLGMGSGRHLYRSAALAPHLAQIHERTELYEAALAEFNRRRADGTLPAANLTGEQIFMNCAACHARHVKLVGPPLTEIAKIYANNPAGIVAWATAPGKKRLDFPQMPPMTHLGADNLRKVADFMLKQGGGK